jgi:hypothetical protein
MSFLLRLVSLLDFSSDSFCNVMDEDEDAEEENWLPNSSPDVLPLSKSEWVRGSKKRVPSAASEVLASDTPVRKRMRLGKKRYFVLQVVKCEAGSITCAKFIDF